MKKMSDYLIPTDFKKVYTATFEARNQWRNILLVLDVSPATIDDVGTKFSNNPNDCYREGLKEWLKYGERSWEDVVNALSSPTVGHSDIARTVEKDHVQSRGASNATNPKPKYEKFQKINDDLTVFLDQRLGKGAFGAVFKSSYKGEICAIKVLIYEAIEMQTDMPMGTNEEANKTFDRECKFLESLQHPNVVLYLSTAKHPKSGGTLLVVELMDCSLTSYLSGLGEESLTSECEISLSKDVSCGLAYIHSKQIIHRDLCGDNVLLKITPVLVAKISDFGMSRLYDSCKLTHTLTVLGHRRGYLPPEATRKKEERYDSSLDVFSLGAIMAQIVCKLDTIKSAKDRLFHVSQIPRTHRLRELIDSCLQEDMTRRPSARDIYASLTRDSDPVEATKSESKDTIPGPPPGELRPPLTLKWRRGKDMPIKMGYTVQSVVIGDTVYVGGSSAGNDRDGCTVMKLEQDQWTKLSQYTTKNFTMISLDNRLVLVGGCDPTNNKQTNQLAVFESGKWTHPYPPMKIARRSSTTVSFNNHIIVAGGWGDKGRISSVEVLDVASRRWHIAQSLPNPRSGLKSTLIGNTLYLMGGFDHTERATKTVHHVDLNELIAKALSNLDTPTLWQTIAKAISNLNTHTLWQTIQDTPLVWSAPLSIGRSLLAVGGHYGGNGGNASSWIHLYQPDTRRWVKVGDLPTARSHCTCSVLPSGEVIVAGGMAEYRFSDTVDFLNFYNAS